MEGTRFQRWDLIRNNLLCINLETTFNHITDTEGLNLLITPHKSHKINYRTLELHQMPNSFCPMDS